MSSHSPRTPDIGVKGLALCQQATSDLAIAHLHPTVPEHEIHRHQHADMHLVLLLAGRYVSDAAGMPAVKRAHMRAESVIAPPDVCYGSITDHSIGELGERCIERPLQLPMG